jgi:hypothetical protein
MRASEYADSACPSDLSRELPIVAELPASLRLTGEVRCLAWEPGRYIRHGVLRGLAMAT